MEETRKARSRRPIIASEVEKIEVPKASIVEFNIKGLHGEKDISLKFQKGVKIIVADNGSGKTTLLNTLYAILEGNFLKLGWLDFQKISLVFESGEKVEFLKDELPDPMKWAKSDNPFLDEMKRFLGSAQFNELGLIVEKSVDEDDFRENLSAGLRKNIIASPYTTLQAYRQMRDIREIYNRKPTTSSGLREKWRAIRKNFNYSVIHMPTYRRVEEDFRNLGLSNRMKRARQFEERHIFFGMSDVKETFERVTSDIRQSTSDIFRAVSSKVIDELFEGKISNSQQLDISRLKDPEAINLVLKRLGKELSSNRLDQLNDFIKHPHKIDNDGRMLLYLLNNFFGIYEAQINKDRSIKSFVRVANRYLSNKELRYDEVNISIGMFSNLSNEEIDVEKLSSGEKQIVSILSRLYLSESENFALIIDEPELSLSIEWQRTLIPDLLRSGKCRFLLAATHSPFIIDNELEKFTSTIISKRVA